jgi:hypothetical protein
MLSIGHINFLFFAISDFPSKSLFATSAGRYYTNSVALVSERTIPTERQPFSTKLVQTFTDRMMSRSQRGRFLMKVISDL